VRRTLAFTALALLALAVASCQTWTARETLPQGGYVPVAPPGPVPPQPLPPPPGGLPPGAGSVVPPSVPSPIGAATGAMIGTAAPSPAPAPDPLDLRRILLEKKAKLLTLEAQKLALEKSLRDLRAEIAAEEKKLEKLPKSKAATKAKLPTVTQHHSASKAPTADADVTLASQLEAILRRLDRLERRPPSPAPPPGVPAP
jgi:hypothetical protein